MPQASNSILVIRLGSLGDLVLMIPMLGELRRSAPGARICLVCKAKYAGLFEGNGLVDHLVRVERGDLRELVSIRRSLAEERFDAIIDAHNVIRSNLLYRSLRARKKLQIRKSEAKKLFLIAGKIDLYRRAVTQAERYLELARELGCSPGGTDRLLPIPAGAAESASSILARSGLGARPVVAMAPGARWPTKRWPLEHFSELVQLVAKRGYSVALIGGEEDTALGDALAREAPGAAVTLAGRLSILESAAVLERCAALVTNDSAPLHLAEAVGTPVVAFFGPTVRQFGYYPRLPRSRALERSLGCRPCSRNGARPCPYGTKECLVAIPPREAFEALDDAVAESGRKP